MGAGHTHCVATATANYSILRVTYTLCSNCSNYSILRVIDLESLTKVPYGLLFEKYRTTTSVWNNVKLQCRPFVATKVVGKANIHTLDTVITGKIARTTSYIPKFVLRRRQETRTILILGLDLEVE